MVDLILCGENLTNEWKRNGTEQVQRCGPFEAARSILGGERTPLKERYEAFFTDYSLLPLLVHQNYPSSLMKIDPSTRTDVTMRAAAACSDADIISGKMRYFHF